MARQERQQQRTVELSDVPVRHILQEGVEHVMLTPRERGATTDRAEYMVDVPVLRDVDAVARFIGRSRGRGLLQSHAAQALAPAPGRTSRSVRQRVSFAKSAVRSAQGSSKSSNLLNSTG